MQLCDLCTFDDGSALLARLLAQRDAADADSGATNVVVAACWVPGHSRAYAGVCRVCVSAYVCVCTPSWI